MKWLLLGLGAYVLYEYLYGTPIPSSAATGGTTVTTTPPPTGSVGAGTGSVGPTKIGVSAASLTSAAGGALSMTADQWNYYYSKLTGVHQTADLFVSGNRGQVIDVNTYLARRATAGLSGFSVQGLSRFTPDYGNVGKYFRGM